MMGKLQTFSVAFALFSSWLLVFPVPVTASSTNQDVVKDSFLRDVTATTASKGRRSLTLDWCDTGCDGNNDCENWLVCYFREAGDAIPKCCSNGNFVRSTSDENYCVTAGCAAWTLDPTNPDPIANLQDDDYLNENWPEIEECEGDCDYNYQCKGDLVCYQRDKDDNTPNCCSGLSKKDSTDYCVPSSCLPPTPAPTPISDNLEGLCFSGDTHVTYVELAGGTITLPFLTQAQVVHWWLSPLRLVCLASSWQSSSSSSMQTVLCHTHTRKGKLFYVDVGLRLAKFMERQHVILQVVVLIPIMAVLAVPVATEYLFGAARGLIVGIMVGLMLGCLALLRYQARIHGKKHGVV
ncbi:expressed unknown protein [Seminavis robusta]|uniref:Uncharacterized protein n=1 Tax=Seminavis robusta TaxID=568900 RepID=A0A9N8DW96_9STRA|nr:expressed unknown protein [Seminavis robusta]|eukprot:Sro342_g121790.1 n/a (351) ;mRNA; f:52869-54690